jgi:hypothetical protein
MTDFPENSARARYAFASDFDGDLCLIAPAGTRDWCDWRVYKTNRDGVCSTAEADSGRFAVYVHGDAEAIWDLEWAVHVEVAIPGEAIIVMHPGVFQPDRCPVCGYRGPRQMPQAGSYRAGGSRLS